MPWPGGKEINYEEEFGVKSKEELKAKLAKVADLETINSSLKNTVETQTGELNTVKATLARIEEGLANGNNNNSNVNNGGNNNNVEIPSVTEDENAAFATRMAPLWERTLATQARINKMDVVNRLRSTDPYFGKLEKDFEELVKTIPLAQAGQGSEVFENAYLIVKAKNIDKILNDTKAGKGEFFIESARNSGNSGNGAEGRDNKDPNELSEDEKIIASRMGLTPEQFAKTRNSGVQMGGRLKYA